ncbi:DegT/DnrJ/EryC1/StrS family aminotransferase [Paracoccus indicus]|uniref:DegT/DnrJ/EryC1/StrS family aminotransferase n=1 Tax=Paracoccus indicus TaxID=2079229 RepID=UPI000D38B6DC|nr:DegT/DnrJ/EryC1/StrS family aminotransferase [Paracoccus indicus]
MKADALVTFGRPIMPDPQQIAHLMSEAVTAGWLSNGGILHERLERRLMPLIGGGTVRLVSSGTMALMMALRMGDLPEGSEVITTPLSFAATVQAILWCGFKPVFADIDPVTLSLCPDAVERAITPRTAAILPVHFFGVPCDVGQMGDLAARHGLWLVYDAAHAFGLTLDGRPIAEWGDASAFSLHATKLMHTGEGGAVALPGRQADRMVRMRNFGLEAGRMVMPGINAKMSEAQAATGLSVLDKLDAEIATRIRLRALYDDAFGGLSRVSIHPNRKGASDSMIYYPLRMPAALRPRLMFHLAEAGIHARDHFPLLCGPGTMLPDSLIATTGGPAIAPDVAPEFICLPLHSGVTDRDVDRMAAAARKVCDEIDL